MQAKGGGRVEVHTFTGCISSKTAGYFLVGAARSFVSVCVRVGIIAIIERARFTPLDPYQGRK